MKEMDSRSGNEDSVLEHTCISFPRDEHNKKKINKTGSQQHTRPRAAVSIALETTQGHFVLLCQLSHPIQRDGGERK